MDRRPIVIAGAVTAAVIGLGAVQLHPGTAPVARADGLVGYDDCAALLTHYRDELTRTASAYGYGGFAYGVTLSDTAASATAGSGATRDSAESGAVGSGATGTNLQEQDVDEPDLAKLADGRLLVLTGNRLRVLSAEPQPRLLGSLRVGDGQTYGGEVLLVGDRALVLVPGYRAAPDPATGSTSGTASDTTADRSMIFQPGTPTTRVLLLDVSGDQPRLLETATYDAQYVSARLHDGTVRLVTTTRPQPPVVYPRGPSPAEERLALTENQLRAADITLRDVVPQVRRIAADGTVQQEGSAVDCRRTYHAQSPRGVSTLMVTTMRPADGLAATDSTAVTTDGDLVYASSDRLYVATSRWGTVGPFMPMTRASSRVAATDEVSTELHGFDISSGTETRYLGSGSVPGYVLGRWALSSHEGALRVATTRQPPWDSERAGNTSSMVVKLAERDGRLVETGRVEGLGRTEQIRAVRYFGDVAAVVTFRQTDPLYLLDLSGTPRVLGELKVPGFSTYLHPLGDGKLLGLGQDADENGQVTGVQVSVFDIADLSKPSLVDRLRLGHGWSPALDDSRAFTYDPDRRTASFAFTSYDPTGKDGQTASAALGIAVDGSGHLREVGRMPLAVDTWSARVLVDDERVYAVGESGVVAGDAATLTTTGSLDFGLSG